MALNKLLQGQFLIPEFRKFTIILFLFLWKATGVLGQVEPPLWKTQPIPPPLPKADKSGLMPIDSINIYYAIYNENGKEPVILLHGGLVNSDEWGFEVPFLSKTHKVIVMDSRGHGRSTLGSKPLTYNLLSSDVLQLMDYLKINKASIVGWSDGGIVGLILAIKHPERLDKLFTFGTNYNLSGYKNEPWDPILAKRFMERAEANYRLISPTPNNFHLLKKALGQMYSTEPNLSPLDLKKIKIPTIIAGGQYDQFIKAEHFKELSEIIPSAKLVIIPNISHGGPLQDPKSFHQAVSNLLDDGR